MDTSLLAEVGLTPREIEIYLALLRHGPCLANKLSKHSSVSRTHIYEALNMLKEKGLVSSVVQDFAHVFSATAPDNISAYLDRKKAAIEQQQLRAKVLETELKKLRQPMMSKPKIEVYEGREGVKHLFVDVLKQRKELMVINVAEHTKDVLGPYAQRFFAEKKKRKIPSRIIFSKKFPFLDPTAKKRFMLRKDTGPAMTAIYGDKVVLVLWLEQPVSVVIESKEAAREYKEYFEVLWKASKS